MNNFSFLPNEPFLRKKIYIFETDRSEGCLIEHTKLAQHSNTQTGRKLCINTDTHLIKTDRLLRLLGHN